MSKALTPREIHGQAEHARESGEFLAALKFTDEATLAYQQANDWLGFAEVQSSRFITFKHLYQQTEFSGYLILAKHAALSSVEAAQMSQISEALALPFMNLGEAEDLLANFPAAVDAYQHAVAHMESHPPEMHNRPAVLLNIKNHLYTCQYKAGDKTALTQAEESVTQLENTEEISRYNKDVWLSGGHMRIASMLKNDNPEKAREHLTQAKAIIDSNPDLKIRKTQWKKLAQNPVVNNQLQPL